MLLTTLVWLKLLSNIYYTSVHFDISPEFLSWTKQYSPYSTCNGISSPSDLLPKYKLLLLELLHLKVKWRFRPFFNISGEAGISTCESIFLIMIFLSSGS